ncbi:hypothetical protein LWF15_02655 [Kineosporia rhizophila]|uniref:hypothetical protein n=1 Tax=Kineosporia TaxID=49184 RepID=UPI000B0C0568|nr:MULTISPECIES: hypothetical protein [Kineosporia]MCE0534399.1 hypothetical protein [Kineosporia rhizophila]GLY13933.1 hypothetical protein Kisp01_09490 [Kineosporia sp. NBRC 101677]
MTTRSKVMAFAGFGLAAAVGISGCGSDSGSASGDAGSGVAQSDGTPKGEVIAAFQGLNESSNAGFTLKLESSPEDIKKINAAQDAADKIDAADRKAIEQVLSGKVTMNMTAPDGKTFGDLTKESTANQDAQALLQDPAALEAALKGQGSFAMSVVLEDSGLFEFVTKDGVIYVRADVDKIAELAEQNVSALESQLGQLPPVIATPVQKLLDGEWVSLDLIATVKSLDEQGVLDQIPQETVSPTVDQAKVQAFLDSLSASFEADAQIDEIDGGDRGDGYRVTVPAKKIATSVQNDLIGVVGQESADEIRDSIKEMPEKDIAFDVFVKDDKLTGVNLDLVQFLDKPVEDATFAVDLAVDAEASAVQVPGNATAVDIKGIFGLIPADSLSGLAGGGTGL